jgi:hypothetical protein
MTKIAAMLLVCASILAGCKKGEDWVLPNQSMSSIQSVHN